MNGAISNAKPKSRAATVKAGEPDGERKLARFIRFDDNVELTGGAPLALRLSEGLGTSASFWSGKLRLSAQNPCCGHVLRQP